MGTIDTDLKNVTFLNCKLMSKTKMQYMVIKKQKTHNLFFMLNISCDFLTVHSMLHDYIMHDWGLGWQLRFRNYSLTNSDWRADESPFNISCNKRRSWKHRNNCSNYKVVRKESKSRVANDNVMSSECSTDAEHFTMVQDKDLWELEGAR